MSAEHDDHVTPAGESQPPGVNASTHAESPTAEDSSATQDTLSADATAVWQATRALARAIQGFSHALLGLARSEWQLARASWPWLFAILVLLVGLSLSLWASVIALAGWGLYTITGSVGWSLTALVGLHVVLLLMLRITLKRTSHNMTMPATRGELRNLLDRARHDKQESE